MAPGTAVEPQGSAGEAAAEAVADPLNQCLELLAQRDDTSRFVGLAMLSSILSRVRDEETLRACWDALDPRFLDRLMRAGETKPPAEARDMVDLAVNVLHAFATSLPRAGSVDTLAARAPAMMRILRGSSTATAATVLETLLVVAADPQGAEHVLAAEHLAVLLALAAEHGAAVQVLLHACTNVARSHASRAVGRLAVLLPAVAQQLRTPDRALRLRLLSFVSELLSRLPSEVLPADDAWVRSVYSTVRSLITSSHTAEERAHCIAISASLLHAYPPALLYASTPAAESPAEPKPFLYLLLQFATIDIRASFPSLLESLASPSYAGAAARLAADFDVLAAFLGYLVTLDDAGFDNLIIPPDLLLKLRKDLAETFSLTIEFLRDRWDAAYAGAAGLDPGFEQGVPKQLTWTTTLPGGLERDPLVIGAVRALALWLRDDESLRKEAAGLMDLFLGLWERGAGVGVDYRVWLVGALEGVLEEKDGREMFLKMGGWQMLWKDLRERYTEGEGDVRLAITEAGVLAEVVAAEGVANAGWAQEVTSVAGVKGKLYLDAAVARLAVSCLAALHKADRARLNTDVAKLKDVCMLLATEAKDNPEEKEALEIVLDTREELEGL